MLIFGREPAAWLALVAALVQGISAFFFPLTVDQQGVINALAVAAVGLITAVIVKSDNVLPAITGVGKALLALGLAFGLNWSPDAQSAAMILVTAVAAFAIRDRVTAPVNAQGQPVPQVTLRKV
jgi:hypothetical protein